MNLDDRKNLTAAVFSSGIWKIRGLKGFLAFSNLFHCPSNDEAEHVDVVLTWGNKSSGRRALDFAARHDKPIWRLEDGFFRSIAPGQAQTPLSLIVDPVGIYYDAHYPSRLENLLNGCPCDLHAGEDPLQGPQLLERARALLALVRKWGVSKYNEGSFLDPKRSERRRARVLLVDQTQNDASVAGALADDTHFQGMLDVALGRFSATEIAIKLHPEVVGGRKRGYLSELIGRVPGVQVWSDTVSPYALLEQTDEVFTVSSQLGFEALVAKKPVTCFGAPFYSGWGLTDDHVAVERRTQQRSLEQLAAAAWLLYPLYRDPITETNVQAESIVELLALQRRMFTENAGRVGVVGFSKWKRPAARFFLGGASTDLRFVKPEAKEFESLDRVVVWGQRGRAQSAELCERSSIPLQTIEDGFIRSLELGSDLSLPLSLSVDDLGIYYDPTASSRLEQLLLDQSLGTSELERAARLRQRIVSSRVTKYAVQNDAPLSLASAGRDVVLVVGQVEDDASVLLGSPEVKSNDELLRRARARFPDSFLIYKPHPDVLSGNRRGELSSECESLADRVERERSVLACLDACQCVVTMTSLVGFEALLRKKLVVTFGLPFYACWGLTEDLLTHPNRSRFISLDELTHAALIGYPRYVNYELGYFVSPEQALSHLEKHAASRGPVQPTLYRRLKRWARYVRGGLLER